MNWSDGTAGWLVAALVCLLLIARVAGCARHPFRVLLAGAVCGLGALAIVALLEPVTGISLPFNRLTAFIATVLGVPGVALLFLLRVML